MNIWLIMSGEPLEMFGERPHRVGILSKMLVEKGHNVTWWTTTFDHQYKKYLYNKTTKLKNKFGVNMIFLHSKTSYKKNISFSRIKNHREVSKEFARVAKNIELPDIILTAFPTIDLAYEAIKFGKKHNIPVIVDVRDLWPDIFLNVFPKMLSPIIKVLLFDYFNKTKFIFSNATAITAVSEKYLQFGLNYANRDKSFYDKVFPLGYNKVELSNEEFKQLEKKFEKKGINKNKKNIWFVGTFGKTYDLVPVIKVANELINYDDIRFIFTGDGEMYKEWKQLANDKNIIFTGWLNQKELIYLAQISYVGLMAYKKGAPQGLPNKIFEYMAYGLPILSSLENETRLLIEKENIGFTYDPDNRDQLKNIIINLVNNEKKYKEMSKKSIMLFEKKYSAKKIYSDFVNYLIYLKTQNKGLKNV